MHLTKIFFKKINIAACFNVLHNLALNYRKIVFGTCLILILSSLSVFHSTANAETRTLKLYNQNTKERAEIIYKKKGVYQEEGLQQLNEFMADWRKKKTIKMDPKLFDLLWEIYQESGSEEEIHIISAYRTRATNNMLRSRSRNVAFNSQHTKGKAIDFHLPDVELSKVRAIALRKQYGGVGYYPKARSPFTHLDTGEIRHWPRLTRKQLVELFPDEETVHVPRDNRPLSGFQVAFAKVKDEGRVPMIVFDENNKVTVYEPGAIPKLKVVKSSNKIASTNLSPTLKPNVDRVTIANQTISQRSTEVAAAITILPVRKSIAVNSAQQVAAIDLNLPRPLLKPQSSSLLLATPIQPITIDGVIEYIINQPFGSVIPIENPDDTQPEQIDSLLSENLPPDNQLSSFNPALILAHSSESGTNPVIDDLDLVFASKNPIPADLSAETQISSLIINDENTSLNSENILAKESNNFTVQFPESINTYFRTSDTTNGQLPRIYNKIQEKYQTNNFWEILESQFIFKKSDL